MKVFGRSRVSERIGPRFRQILIVLGYAGPAEAERRPKVEQFGEGGAKPQAFVPLKGGERQLGCIVRVN